MEIFNEQCKQIIRAAYDIQNTARARLVNASQEDIALHLAQLIGRAPPEPKPAPGYFLDDLSHPYWQAVEVAEDAWRLGIGILIADFLACTAQGDFRLMLLPMETNFKRRADSAMQAVLKHWNNHAKARALPELRTAYQQLDAMIGVLYNMMRDCRRAEMGITSDWHATKRDAANVVRIENLATV